MLTSISELYVTANPPLARLATSHERWSRRWLPSQSNPLFQQGQRGILRIRHHTLAKVAGWATIPMRDPECKHHSSPATVPRYLCFGMFQNVSLWDPQQVINRWQEIWGQVFDWAGWPEEPSWESTRIFMYPLTIQGHFDGANSAPPGSAEPVIAPGEYRVIFTDAGVYLGVVRYRPGMPNSYGVVLRTTPMNYLRAG